MDSYQFSALDLLKFFEISQIISTEIRRFWVDFDEKLSEFHEIAMKYCNILLRISKKFDAKINTKLTLLPSEKELIKNLVKFPRIISEAAESYSPAVIANYCYELVKLYNQFYQNVKILPENETEIRNNRLLISKSTAKVIDHSLNLLGIYAPNRM